jgi:hypothetical protein
LSAARDDLLRQGLDFGIGKRGILGLDAHRHGH